MLGILVIEIKLKYQFWIVLHCWAMAGRLVSVKSKRLQLVFLHYLCDFCLLDIGYAQVHGQSVTDLKAWRSRQCCVRSLVAFCVPMGVLTVAEAQSAGGSSGLGFKGEGGQRMSNIGRGHWAGQRELDIWISSAGLSQWNRDAPSCVVPFYLWCVQVRYPRPAGQTSNLNNFMSLVKKIKMAAATVTEHLPFLFHLMWDGKKMLQVGLSQLQTEQGKTPQKCLTLNNSHEELIRLGESSFFGENFPGNGCL